MTETASEYVTVQISGETFGLPIARVHDVFMLGALTAVPLAPPDITGVLNLRGRIVTAIDMRTRLGFDAGEKAEEPVAIGVEHNGESYGLVVDAVSEVMRPDPATRQALPVNLDPRLARYGVCVYRLAEGLLVILDVDRLLDVSMRNAA